MTAVRLLDLLRDSLQFDYVEGARHCLPGPHSTGWRRLPFAVCAQIPAGRVRIRLDGGADLTCGHGQAFVIPAGVRNCVEKIPPGVLRSRFAHFRVTILDGIDAFDLLDVPMIVSAAKGRILGGICGGLADCGFSGNPLPLAQFARQKSLGFQLFAAIADLSAVRADAGVFVEGLERLSPVFRAIREDPARPFTVRELADLVYLSPSRFHALFRKTMGTSPLDHVQKLRMDQARTLLLATDCSAKEVASRSGYPDACHFSRLFRRLSGMSPLQYRRRVRDGLWRAAGAGGRSG